MADFFLDVSALGNEYQAWANTPASWAVPQDGNGKGGPGHSAAVPVAEVTFDAVPTSGACNVYGTNVTLSGVLSAGSTDAAATALAASINATTTTIGSSVCRRVLPMNRFVYARVKPGGGANDSIVQIMCRIAGADLNYPANASARVTNTFNASAMASPVDFTGGADGPWAYWWATASGVFGQTYPSTTSTYGVACNEGPGPATYSATADIVYVRTRRAGVDLTAGVFNTSTGNISMTMVTRAYVFDDGSTWSGDDGQFAVETFCTQSAGIGCQVFWAAGTSIWAARKKWGFRWTHNGSGTTGFSLRFLDASGGVAELTNLHFEASGSGRVAFTHASANTVRLYRGCRMSFRGPDVIAGNGTVGQAWIARFIDCDLEYVAAISTPTGIVDMTQSNSTGTGDSLLEMLDCRFSFTTGGPITQLFAGANFPSTFRAIIENCVGLRPEVLPAAAGDTGQNRGIIFSGCADVGSGTIARSFLVDNGHGMLSWTDNNTHPYLGGALASSGSPWSIRCAIKAGRSSWVVVNLFRWHKRYRGPDAAKVIVLELLVPTAVAFNRSQFGLMVTFTDSGGNLRHASTLEPYLWVRLGTTNAIASSGASWSGASGYDPKRLELDTDALGYEIKQDTEISARLVYQGNTPGGVDRNLWLHPELTLEEP